MIPPASRARRPAASTAVAAGYFLRDLRLPQALAGAVLVYAVGAVAMCAIGFVLAALAPDARTANAIGFVIYFPMIFLSGAVIPRHGRPAGRPQGPDTGHDSVQVHLVGLFPAGAGDVPGPNPQARHRGSIPERSPPGQLQSRRRWSR
jgi:ABC-2 type transport system permease protein